MANIQIQNLPSASSPLNGGAYAIIKDGLQDKKATITQLREIDVSAFTNMASTPVASDLMIVGRGSSTFKTLFSNVGFVTGVTSWFYQAVAPSGWAIIPGLSDCLLAVQGGSVYVNPGSGANGGWMQTSHVLTVNEIPAHTHNVRGRGAQEASGNKVRGYQPGDSSPDYIWPTQAAGGGQGHNHGDTWRPLAAVGIVCRKG